MHRDADLGFVGYVGGRDPDLPTGGAQRRGGVVEHVGAARDQ